MRVSQPVEDIANLRVRPFARREGFTDMGTDLAKEFLAYGPWKRRGLLAKGTHVVLDEWMGCGCEVLVVERIELPAKAVASTPLVLATEILLQRSMRRREIDGRSVRRADWAVELENGERQQLRFVFREPTADQSRMLFIARNGIERLDLAAPATAVGLTLSGICSEYVRQERLWETGPRGAAALGEAIEQLSVREGSPQIYRVVEVEPWSRIPERQRALAAYYP